MITSAALCSLPAHGSELVTLRNGFDVLCDHRVGVGDRVRLYLFAGGESFVELSGAEIASIEPVHAPLAATLHPDIVTTGGKVVKRAVDVAQSSLSADELHQMLATAGSQRNIDVDLLASVVRAESGGRVRAVSRSGAQGLMQLMPGTAAEVGVKERFRPEENIRGGTAYLDMLLVRYKDNLALALAAYNAGPAAVERWRGVPPYRETRAYVARVIRDFNSRRAAPLAARKLVGGLATGVASKVAFGTEKASGTIASR
ncbi:MAG TPA: lytic transglycosylase domain-containing protein [Acidisarcina sp.]